MLVLLLRLVLLLFVLTGGVVMVTVVVPFPLDVIDSLPSVCAFRRRLYGVKSRTGPDAANVQEEEEISSAVN